MVDTRRGAGAAGALDRLRSLGPDASVVVPVAEIVGIWPGEREAIVYWWHVVPDGAGGYRAEEVQEIIVPL